MRLLEITLIVANLVILFLPRANRRYAAIALLIVAALHLVIDQPRWQMVPAYVIVALTVIFFLLDISMSRGWVGTLGAVGASLLLLLSWGIGTLFPIVRLSPLTGPHQVGSMTVQLVDEGRDEVYSAEPDDKRELVTTIWYPANPTNEPLAPFLPHPDVGARTIASDFELPAFMLTHAQLVKTRAHLNAPASDGAFPVVFFSHGLGGIRGQNTQMVEELVSQGYVVVAANHTYAAAYTVLDEDRVITYDRGVIAWDTPRESETAQQLVATWAEDLRFILRQLDQYNADPSHPLSGHLQLEQVGVFGHSTGGGTSFEFCYREPRCAAALGLDPWVVPTSDAAVAEGITQPALIMRNPEGLSDINLGRLNSLYESSSDQRGHWVITGTRHYDYTDFKRLSRALTWIGLTGDIDANEIRDLMDRGALALFDATLKGGDWAALDKVSAEFSSINAQD